MNAINTEAYHGDRLIRLESKSGLGSLSIGDIISGTLTANDGKNALITMENGKSFRVDSKNIIEEIGEKISFEVADVHGNSVVMKKINEENEEELNEQESADLTGEKLLNWAKGAVLPITGAAFASSKIAAEKNAENDAKMLGALNSIKRDIIHCINNVSGNTLSFLAANGISLDSITVSMMTAAVKSAAGLMIEGEASEKKMAEALESYSQNNNEYAHKEVLDSIRALCEEDLPLTDTNIDTLMGIKEKLKATEELTTPDRISFLRKQREATLENVFTSIHSANGHKNQRDMTETEWKEALPGVKKYLKSLGMPESGECLSAAKTLIANEIPVTEESVGFITGKLKQRDTGDIIRNAARNMAEGKSPLSVNLYNSESIIAIDRKELLERYKTIIKELPDITENALKDVVERGEPITIAALISAQKRLAGNGNKSNNGENENTKCDETIVAERIKLEEVRLRLTISAASQMARAGISIDSLELQAAINELKTIELKTNEAALRIVGTEATDKNAAEMSFRAAQIRGLSNTYDEVKRKVVNKEIEFTAEKLAEANETARARAAREGYEAAETAPNAKFGDSVNKALNQVGILLESIGIEAFPENVKAARSLVRAGEDVTKESIEAIKAINNKIENVTRNLHPIISAQMIKDGFNPLTAHIDEVIAYIERYNEIYGEPPVEAMEKAIFNMDKDGTLSKDERDSLIAMYRMMSAINSNETVSAAIITKSGKSHTLENLMESGKYYAKTGARRAAIDRRIDDGTGGNLAGIATGSIREQLGRSYENAVRRLNESGVSKETAEETAQLGNLGLTAQNVEMMEAIYANGMELSEYNINSASNVKYSFDKLLSGAKSGGAMKYLKSLGENISKTNIRELLEGMSEFFGNHTTNDARLSMSESAAFSTFKDDLKSLAAVSPQQLAWMMAMNLPLTVGNIKTVYGMSGEKNYLGKRVEELNRLAEKIAGDKLDAEIPASDLSKIIEGAQPSDIIDGITEKIDEILDKAVETEAEGRQELLSQASMIENAANIMRQTGGGYYQIPMKLHDKIGSLNVYVLNRGADTKNMSAFIRLDMTELGTIQASVNFADGFADIVLSAENEENTGLLEKNADTLRGYMEEIGLKNYRISFKQEKADGYFGGEHTHPENDVKAGASGSDGRLDIRL